MVVLFESPGVLSSGLCCRCAHVSKAERAEQKQAACPEHLVPRKRRRVLRRRPWKRVGPPTFPTKREEQLPRRGKGAVGDTCLIVKGERLPLSLSLSVCRRCLNKTRAIAVSGLTKRSSCSCCVVSYHRTQVPSQNGALADRAHPRCFGVRAQGKLPNQSTRHDCRRGDRHSCCQSC